MFDPLDLEGRRGWDDGGHLLGKIKEVLPDPVGPFVTSCAIFVVAHGTDGPARQPVTKELRLGCAARVRSARPVRGRPTAASRRRG